jgi:hypothetical protein
MLRSVKRRLLSQSEGTQSPLMAPECDRDRAELKLCQSVGLRLTIGMGDTKTGYHQHVTTGCDMHFRAGRMLSFQTANCALCFLPSGAPL